MNIKEKLKILSYLIILLFALAALKFLSVYEFNDRKNKAVYELAWVEEFDGDTLNKSIWTVIDNNSDSAELQNYTKSNYTLQNGFLNIQVKHDTLNNHRYLSSFIKGIKPMDFDSGYVEVAIKPITLEGVQNRFVLKSSSGAELSVVKHNGNPESITRIKAVISEKDNFDFSLPFTINISVGVSQTYLSTQKEIQNDFFPQEMIIDYIKIYKRINQKILF